MNSILQKIILCSILAIGNIYLPAQTVYQHTSNKEIYAFLDEMASLRIIELNSAVKPYSRKYIAQKLQEVSNSSINLNKRQQKELEFYLKDYIKELQHGSNSGQRLDFLWFSKDDSWSINKKRDKRLDLLFYSDSLITFSLNPIAGVQRWYNDNGMNQHRWNGADIFAYVGEHVGVYANLRDNNEIDKISDPVYLDTRPAARYKNKNDYSEMRGGITYSWNWGHIGLVKDHLEWGNNYHYPSIYSAKVPSIAQLKLNMKPAKWFEFNYLHGWLVSGIVDSANSYHYTNSYGDGYRLTYRKKYISSNFFTFKPFKDFHFSIGNTILYSDMDAHPAYLIPFMLYKSIDHTLNQTLSNEGGHNSQLFFDISSRNIKHLHLYGTWFFDDVSLTRFWENYHFDYFSMNVGMQIADLIPNTFITFEYFQSYPLVYKHDMPTTTYESNFYNLGHYMQDNSRNIYSELKFRPLRGLSIAMNYTRSVHGPDHEEMGTPRLDVVNLLLSEIDWKREITGLKIQWQMLHDVYIFGEFKHSKVSGNQEKYTMPFYYGTTNTLSAGLNIGF